MLVMWYSGSCAEAAPAVEATNAAESRKARGRVISVPFFVTATLISDIINAILDPRLRSGEARR